MLVVYSKEKVLKVLRDFQKEFYGIFREIRISASQIMNRI